MAKGGNVIFDFEGNTSPLLTSMKSVTKGILKGSAAIGTGLTALVGASVKAYADVEQAIGGVETLFKNSADTVIKNAERAYMTAGISANSYMEQVTSFSASLLQSLGGDTKKAAEYADRAVIDMADNANKMGTSIEMIQNAYQGFAKQNYTMLDNLKLGYGGTKTEMERLISDASRLTSVQKELGIKVDANDMSFGNIVNAISIIQKEMGIAGTTSLEASGTITGSINSLKSSFSNFLSGMGSADSVVTTFVTAFTNISDTIIDMAPSIVKGVVEIAKEISKKLPKLINDLLPVVVDGVMSLVLGITDVLPQLITSIASLLPQIITTITNMAPQILKAVIDVIPVIAEALAQNLPSLIPAIVQGIILIMQVFNENMPLFIKCGIQVIVGLVKGLINSIPLILKNLPTIITFILNFFTASKLLSAGKNLLTGLGNGLIKGIPALIKKLPQIITKIISFFKTNGVNSFKTIGTNLIKGLWNGIQNMKSYLLNKVKGLGKSVLSGLNKILGIHSPSKETFQMGVYMDEGMLNGMDSMKKKLQTAFNGVFNFSPNISGMLSNHFSPQVNVVNNISMEQDPLGQMVRKIKTFSGGSKNDFNYGMGV